MKKALLGTTALIAAGLAFGNAAYAADGVKLSIGGRYMGAAGVNFDDADGFSDDGQSRDYVFKQDVEVYFLGETVLDNGLTVGARVELEGQTSSDQIDAVYAYFSGGFGEIRFGDTGEAMAQLCYVAPTASGIFGADSPNFNFSNAGAGGAGNLGIGGYGATNGTCYGLDDKSTKIVYFSPNFAGFSFAASFTPDGTEDTRNTLGGFGTRSKIDGQNSENLSVAANFTHDFNGVNLIVGGGGTWSFDRENSDTDERRDYNAYAQVGFSGFTIGGAFGYRQNRGGDGSDDLIYSAGITYNWDAWTVGFGYSHGQYEIGQPGSILSGNINGASTGPFTLTSDITDYSNIFALTASYALGPGIQIDGVVEYDDYEAGGDEQGRDSDYKGISFGLGTLISF
jgi:outer membrane protein OmpU